jgi:integrase
MGTVLGIKVRHGSVYKRCRACANKVVEGKRCRCGSDNLSWAFKVDVAPPGAPRDQKVRSGFATKAEAVAEMSRLQLAAADPAHVEPMAMTVGQWLDQWLPSVKGSVRGGSWVGYQLYVNKHIKPALGRHQLQRLTRAQLKVFYAGLENEGGLSVKTVHNIALCLHKALGDAVEEGLVTRNPSDGAHSLPRCRDVPMRTWSAEQLRVFLAFVADDRLASLWRLASTTGMRRGEVLGLRWRDVDLDGATLSVAQARVRGADGLSYGPPKTSAGRRRIDLDQTTVASLRDHRRRQTTELEALPAEHDLDLVFTRADGKPLDPDGLSGTFDRLQKAAGLPRIRLHDLRHTVASLLLAGNVPAKVVQERLGHSSVMVTLDIYSHVAPGMQRDATELLERVIHG